MPNAPSASPAAGRAGNAEYGVGKEGYLLPGAFAWDRGQATRHATCNCLLLQIDQDTQEMLRQLGMSNLPGIKMVPVSSAASQFWSAGLSAARTHVLYLPC